MKRSFVKSTFILLFLLVLLFCTSGCTGYNKTMYEYLSEPQNYSSFDATIVSVEESDLILRFDDTRTIAMFSGVSEIKEITENGNRFLSVYLLL